MKPDTIISMEPNEQHNSEELSLFEKWRIYTDALTSPDSYINFGFYYLISASLQRRVWIDGFKNLFPNQFMNLVGPPGVGKGLVTSAISELLKYHKRENPNKGTSTTFMTDKKGHIVEEIDRREMEEYAKADYMAGVTEENRGNPGLNAHMPVEKPLLIPMAADASTYEALVMHTARSLRRVNYSSYDSSLGRNIIKVYTHSSITFCLEEISSLFKKRGEDVLAFLQQSYDCGDYKKETKSQGTDRVYRACVNLIGGITPDAMRRIFRDELLNEGYASRCIFIFEPKNRKTAVFLPPKTELQLAYEQDILKHIKKLTELYGPITIEPEAREWVEAWWKEASINRINVSEKLQHYYARKQIHVLKLATAIHFSESTEMTIGLGPIKAAINLLHSVERRMHYALVLSADNPYYKVGIKVLDYLRDATEPKSIKELIATFWERLPSNEPREAMNKILEYYILTDKVKEIRNDRNVPCYIAIREAPKPEEKDEHEV